MDRKEFLEEVATLEYMECTENPTKNKSERIRKNLS